MTHPRIWLLLLHLASWYDSQLQHALCACNRSRSYENGAWTVMKWMSKKENWKMSQRRKTWKEKKKKIWMRIASVGLSSFSPPITYPNTLKGPGRTPFERLRAVLGYYRKLSAPFLPSSLCISFRGCHTLKPAPFYPDTLSARFGVRVLGRFATSPFLFALFSGPFFLTIFRRPFPRFRSSSRRFAPDSSSSRFFPAEGRG